MRHETVAVGVELQLTTSPSGETGATESYAADSLVSPPFVSKTPVDAMNRTPVMALGFVFVNVTLNAPKVDWALVLRVTVSSTRATSPLSSPANTEVAVTSAANAAIKADLKLRMCLS
jgi:hypothetical protein